MVTPRRTRKSIGGWMVGEWRNVTAGAPNDRDRSLSLYGGGGEEGLRHAHACDPQRALTGEQRVRGGRGGRSGWPLSNVLRRRRERHRA